MLSEDESTVVVLVSEPGGQSLAAVPVGGGPARRLSDPADQGAFIRRLSVSHDGTHVVFESFDVGEAWKLWTVPTDASVPPVQLGAPGLTWPNGQSVDTMSISPDGQSVAYLATFAGDAMPSLLSQPIDGSQPPIAIVTPTCNCALQGFEYTADGERLILVGTDAGGAIWSVPATGGEPVPLVPPGMYNAGTLSKLYQLSPDGSRLIVRGVIGPGVEGLFSVPVTGGSLARLDLGGNSTERYSVTTDGRIVLFTEKPPGEGLPSLYSVPIDGSAPPARLSPIGGAAVDFYVASPDSTRVLYTMRPSLFAVPIGGGTSVQMSNDVAPSDFVSDAAFTNHGAHVVYRTRELSNPQSMGYPGYFTSLMSVPVGGGDAVSIFDPAADDRLGDYTPFGASNDQVFVQVIEKGHMTFSVLSTTSARPPLTVFVAPGSTGRSVITSDGARVLFIAVPAGGGQRRVYSMPLPLEPLPGSAPGAIAGAALTSISPVRVFDSRPGEAPPSGPKGLVGPDAVVDVQVVGDASGVSADAVAVALNVTATGALEPGYLTVFPTGSQRPLASSLNLTAPGQTRANAVVVPVGVNGKVSVYSQAGAHVVIDVTGYFRTAATAVAAGRILPLAPTRIFDSRESEPAPGPKGLVPADGTVTVHATGVAGIPADATAVVLNVTATETGGAGFVTVFPTGQPRPLASTLNIDRAGETAPNMVLAPIGSGGNVDIYTQSTAHLLADVTGYVTGPGATVDDSGLFVPIAPARLFDTRGDQLPSSGPKGRVDADATIGVQVGGQVGPATVGVVLMNLTGTDADSGYITAFPHGGQRPLASSLNLNGPGDTRPNAVLVPVGADGQVDLYSSSGAHLLADAGGYTRP